VTQTPSRAKELTMKKRERKIKLKEMDFIFLSLFRRTYFSYPYFPPSLASFFTILSHFSIFSSKNEIERIVASQGWGENIIFFILPLG